MPDNEQSSFPSSPKTGADREIESELETIQPALRAYVGSLTGASGVGDIVQEANLLIWDKREDFEPGTNFRAWAFRIAYFKVLAYRRDAARERKLVFNDQLLLELAADSQALFEDSAERLNRALVSCIELLPPNQRSLVEQHYYEHVGLTDIAYHSKRKPDAVHKAISRIRLALRKCVNDRLESDDIE